MFSPKRGKRPHEIHAPRQQTPQPKHCFFCPGSEHDTPPEIGRIPDEHHGWMMRWFENKFGVVSLADSPEVHMDDPWHIHQGAFGHHEVIVETNTHTKQLWDLSVQEIAWLLAVYDNRIQKISAVDGIEYVQVFKNHGVNAGTSIIHSHSQVIALPFVPEQVNAEADAVEAHDECPFCTLISKEMNGPRLCYQNESFVVLAPYASQFQYEAVILPRAHVSTLRDISSPMLCADSIAHVLATLKKLNADFNMVVQYGPPGRDFHLHIKFLPRLSTWAGFEYGTNVIVNPILPEVAASFYRGDA